MLNKFWNNISYRHVPQETVNQPRLIQLKIINRLTLGTSIIIFLHVIRDYFFLNFPWTWLTSSRIILAAFLLYCYFHYKARFRAIFQFSLYFILAALIFTMSLCYGVDSDFYLFFFPYLGSFSLLFNDKDNFKYSILLYSLTFLIVLSLNKFQIEPYHFNIEEYSHAQQTIRIQTILEVLILTGFHSYYVFEKNMKLISLNNNYQSSNNEIVALKAAVEDEKINKLEELLELAKSCDPGFLSLFQHIFPKFRDALYEINSNFGQEDFRLCAYIKLGFNTKEIAHYNHLSIRTVQTKKSRLRKTFGVASEKNLYVWVSEIVDQATSTFLSTSERCNDASTNHFESIKTM